MPRRISSRNFIYRPPFRADGAYVLDAGGYVVDQFASGEQILCGCTKVVNAAEFVANALNAQASGVTIERFDAHKGEDWAIRMMANSMRGELDWVKPMWRPYFDAMMKLIAEWPDRFREHGYSLRDIHFRNFKRAGKNNVRLVSCEAFWPQEGKA